MKDALAAAGNVLHNQLLPVRVFWEHRADGAKQDVGGTACCPGDDDLYRLGRKLILRRSQHAQRGDDYKHCNLTEP
jgi:hypothetical protein